jgi:ADP-heptose:LPS heptosyltransferase
MKKSILQRVRARIRWELLVRLKRPASRNGVLYRAYNHFELGDAPYSRKELHVNRPGALGDVLMCTPALKKVKELNPHCMIHFHTLMPELVECLPFIDCVSRTDDLPAEAIRLRYEEILPPSRHIASIFGDQLGVKVDDFRPAINPNLICQNENLLATKRVPRIVINRHASSWTPNKDWMTDYWVDLINRLVGEFEVVDIGTASSQEIDISNERYVDLRGRTNLSQMVTLIARSDLHIGPVSGPVHIAAATDVPCVVIYGGYEHPNCSSYRWNTNLYTALPCSPCWLRTPCPFDRKCLSQIDVDRVYRSAIELIRNASNSKKIRA